MALMLLNGCAGQKDGTRLGVHEARACMKALTKAPRILEGYEILACTNDGVWRVDQMDEKTGQWRKYDFLNREYAGPETGGTFIEWADFDSEMRQNFASLKKELNNRLLRKF
jgi:hypothetical protein